MNVQRLQLPVSSSNCALPSSCSSIQSHSILLQHGKYHSPVFSSKFKTAMCVPFLGVHHPCGRRGRRPPSGVVFVGAEETEVLVDDGNTGEAAAAASGDREEPEPTTEDQEYFDQIRRVLELLRKNRDMLFGEVKLTIMIEDLREDERRRLLGIDGSKAPTRDDLVAALEDVNEGRIPNNRMALRTLAEEMISWPNLEVEAPKKRPKSKSPYAKATDTGVDPQVAAKQRNIDWDSAAEIDELNVADDTEVPQAVGEGVFNLEQRNEHGDHYFGLYVQTCCTRPPSSKLTSRFYVVYKPLLQYAPFQNTALLQASSVMVAPPSQHNSSREFGGSYCEGEDICMTIETDINGSAPSSFDVLAIEQPGVLQNSGSLLGEKQISVDLISLKGTIRQASLRLASPTPTEQKSSGGTNLPLPLQLPKLKFLFTSLNDSAAASPLKKIWKSQNNTSPRPTSKLSRQQSVMDDSHLELQECSMRRSKSMGEGRSSAPADDFDLWLEKPASARDKYKHKQSNSFSKPESTGNRSRKGKIKEMPEEEFKCGKLCLFLPTRGKGKPVRASSSSSSSSSQKTEPPVISRTVSLEKFECGSWSTSALSNENEDGESTNLFFSLPLEMIRCSVTDIQSPVTAAFVFDKEAKLDTEPKGVLRNGSVKANGGRKSQDSSRHVRFSASSHPSSPTCITPRLRKAREDFNAFLEAQSS